MRWWAMMVAPVVCAAGLVCSDARSAEEVAGKVGAARAMYGIEELVGTIVRAQRMYSSEGVEWYKGDLRVDEAQGEESKRQAGEVMAVRYPVRRGPKSVTVGLGDQVRGKLTLEEGAEQQVWLAAEGLERLGRGEFVNPGEGAQMDIGSPEAKILVKMFAPLSPECHRKTAELLKELAGRETERVRVQIFDMMAPAGREEMARERLQCATVLVNNRYRLTLVTPDGPREVAFHHRPNGPRASYNSEDVVAAVEQEIARLYPREDEQQGG